MNEVREEHVKRKKTLPMYVSKNKTYDSLNVMLSRCNRSPCVLTPDELRYLTYIFEESGYFDIKPLKGLDKYRHSHAVLTERKYMGLLKKQCSSFLEYLSEKFNVCFLIYAENAGDRQTAGGWWCKSMLYMVLLLQLYKVRSAAELPLLICLLYTSPSPRDS